ENKKRATMLCSGPPITASSDRFSSQEREVVTERERVEFVAKLLPRILNAVGDPITVQDVSDIATFAHDHLNFASGFLPSVSSVKVFAKLIGRLFQLFDLFPDMVFSLCSI